MTKTKTKTKKKIDWSDYFAIQLTPEEKEAGRAELQKEIDRARAEGVYERIAAYREQQVRKRVERMGRASARVSMVRDGDPPTKRGKK